ncbi:hypothetical protein BQ8420_20660 [Nocardiopsis sp. JB363]|nr:hypothetical protein BQ8420_20660 [Nocardiopsis sp. JB363]
MRPPRVTLPGCPSRVAVSLRLVGASQPVATVAGYGAHGINLGCAARPPVGASGQERARRCSIGAGRVRVLRTLRGVRGPTRTCFGECST